MKTEFIGIDPGMGAVKLWDSAGGTMLPSFVARGGGKQYVSMMGAGRKSSVMSVEFCGQSYFVGRGAHSKGEPLESITFSRLTGGEQIKALLYGALTSRIQEHGPYKSDVSVAVALPIEMMTVGESKENVTKVKKWIVGDHKWTSGSEEYSISISSATVTSQPVGAMLDHALSENGKPIASRKSALKGEIGVISIGFNTVEIMCLENKIVTDRLTSGATDGVKKLLMGVKNSDKFSLGELDDRLRRGALDIDGSMAQWSELITGAIGRTWDTEWERFDAVVVVGGGAVLLNGQLMKYFNGKSVMPDNPVMSISRGLYKFFNGR